MIVGTQVAIDIVGTPMKRRSGVALRLQRLQGAMEFDSQRAFAAYLDVSYNRYNNVARGAYPLSKDLAITIARKCPGVTTDWLLEGDASTLAPKWIKLLSEPPKRSQAE